MGDLLSDCAELALHAGSGKTFNDEFLRLASLSFGAAGGCMATLLIEGGACNPTNNVDDASSFEAAMVTHAGELAPREIALQLSNVTFAADDIFSAQRLDELNLFRNYLPKLGLTKGISRVWFDRDRFHFISMSCSTRADYRKFRTRVIPAMDRVFPVLAVAQRLVQSGSSSADADAVLPADLAREFKLTPAQRDTLSLVLRGLTNPEIARVLGLSVNTVRNRLAVCFEKLGVSRRTEALFILTEVNRKQRVSQESPVKLLQAWLATAART